MAVLGRQGEDNGRAEAGEKARRVEDTTAALQSFETFQNVLLHFMLSATDRLQPHVAQTRRKATVASDRGQIVLLLSAAVLGWQGEDKERAEAGEKARRVEDTLTVRPSPH